MGALDSTDWGASGREDSFELWLVDPFTLNATEQVGFDASGTSVAWGYYTDTKASATVSVLDEVASGSMVRLVHRTRVGGKTAGETLATLFASEESATASMGRVSRSLDCYSALLRHHEDYLMIARDYGPGDNVSEIIREIVEADGGHLSLASDAPTDRLHTIDVHWDIGTNKLSMINTMADWINGQIGVTDSGEVELRYYRAPSDKPASYTFEAGANCICLPGFTASESEGDAYNRAMFYFSTDSASGFAVADLDESHPYSYARIGRHVTYAESLSEELSQEDLDYKARAFLEENCGGAVYYEIEHAGVPGLRPGMTVRYRNATDYPSEIDALCLVTEMSVASLSPMMMTKTKMRVIS